MKRSIEEIKTEILKLAEEFCELKYKRNQFIPGKDIIPPSGKLIHKEEIQNIIESALDGWLTTGRFNSEFENKLAQFVGVKYAITVNSGSSANLIAFNTLTSPKLKSKAINKGDEIISVAAGFPTTVNPIVQFGAIPVFVDIDKNTLNIDVKKVIDAITPKTKAIMLAHCLGNPFNLELIKSVCEQNNLWLIEDCCDALGSKYNGNNVGTFGDIATLSFYPAHHITMGEGGAVLTNNLKLKKIAESFRDWGRDCYCAPGEDNTCNNRFCWTKEKLGGNLPDGYDHKYIYSHLGYNLKITDMQAACGLAQLEKVSKFIQRRKENFSYLKNKLLPLSDYIEVAHSTPNSEPSWFGLPIILKKSSNNQNRKNLVNYLDKKGIGTRLVFAGNITKQPYFEEQNYRIVGDLINTNLIMEQAFWVGIHPAVDFEQLDYTANSIIDFFK